jgi:hypothetical protein
MLLAMLIFSACPFLPVQFCIPALPITFFISFLTHFGCSILSVLFWLSSSDCPVPAFMAVLFYRPVQDVLSWMSCPARPVLAILPQ